MVRQHELCGCIAGAPVQGLPYRACTREATAIRHLSKGSCPFSPRAANARSCPFSPRGGRCVRPPLSMHVFDSSAITRMLASSSPAWRTRSRHSSTHRRTARETSASSSSASWRFVARRAPPGAAPSTERPHLDRLLLDDIERDTLLEEAKTCMLARRATVVRRGDEDGGAVSPRPLRQVGLAAGVPRPRRETGVGQARVGQ